MQKETSFLKETSNKGNTNFHEVNFQRTFEEYFFQIETLPLHLQETLSCVLFFKRIFSHDKNHDYDFIQVTEHSSYSHSSVCLELSHSSSSETSMELIPEESNLPSKPSFQHANFMHLISSRLESTRTTFRNLSKSSFEYAINPSSS